MLLGLSIFNRAIFRHTIGASDGRKIYGGVPIGVVATSDDLRMPSQRSPSIDPQSVLVICFLPMTMIIDASFDQ